MNTCKTCKWWEPFYGVCACPNSDNRADFTDRDLSCPAWERHFCQACGGTLEAREHDGKTFFYCYSCHFEFAHEP